MGLTVDQKELVVPTAGGSVYLTATATSRMAFKIRLSNLDLYRVKPVYGFVEPSGSVKIEVLRFTGAGKQEKLVIQYVDVPEDELDPTASFKAAYVDGEVTVMLKPK